jgi:Mechanosensitive ion channel
MRPHLAATQAVVAAAQKGGGVRWISGTDALTEACVNLPYLVHAAMLTNSFRLSHGVRAPVQVLQVVGVNVQPLLAAGGVSGIALGFGAQKLTQNVLSGAKLFLTQPFVVGERVRLLGSGGGEVVSGIIETVRRRPCSVPPVHRPPSSGQGCRRHAGASFVACAASRRLL